jgi:hypothetical protein
MGIPPSLDGGGGIITSAPGLLRCTLQSVDDGLKTVENYRFEILSA